MATTISYPFYTPKLQTLPNYPSLSKPRNFKLLCCLSLKQSNQPPLTAQHDAIDSLRVVFAAGGTGGHIYPAVAIADELKIAQPTSQILFIGTPNSMESAAITSAGYEFEPVPAVPLARPLLCFRNLLLPYHLIKFTIQSYAKLGQFDPQIVVGTGGYVSFPTCLAAALRGIKLVIQEQKSVPGIANWVLSHLADVVFVAFSSTIDCFPKGKCVVSGNPVRLPLREEVSKEEARRRFFPRSEKVGESAAKVILVLGGSLGANAINIALLNMYHQMLMENDNLFIIWQTGLEAYNEMESLVRNHPHLHLTPFMHSMDMAYIAGDLIISRAGAMTCYEILAYGKPSILIPSPNVAEGHQFKNASLMADLAEARYITEDELDSITLKTTIEEILGDEKKMADMSERALKIARPHASAEIVQRILSLVNLSTAKKVQ